jgi:glycosyltransferase involved in cell wall biosynthesis
MRVLFVSQPNIGLGKGGFQSQVSRTAEALERQGVEIVYHDPWSNPMDRIDLCHFFGPCGPMHPLAIEAKRRSKPIVTSPVLGTGDVPGWQIRWKVRLSEMIPGFYTNYALLKRILGLSDRILALTGEEARTLRRLFNVPGPRIEIVQNGIDPRFSRGDPELVRDTYGVSDFVLGVGTFHPIKNQLTVIRAMNGLRVPLVLVGDALVGHESYLERCRRAADDSVIFAGRLKHEDPLLSSAYAAARVFVLPSLSEVMPLSLYEAALAGCRLVLSKHVPVPREIEGHIDRADPKNPREFRRLIRENLRLEPDKTLREFVLGMPGWEAVGERIHNVYRELLNGRAGGEIL